jgi:phosphotransferase system HPr (HPr) family protein
MCEPKATRTLDVTNPAGIHARAATLIAELVRRSGSRVLVIKDCQRVDGTDVLQILSLGTAQGERVSFEAVGQDAEEVLEALARLFSDNFGDDDIDGSKEDMVEADSPQ